MHVFSTTLRTLNCMVGQMKHILTTEQKKTDFRPEDENNVMIQYTTVRHAASATELTCKTKQICRRNCQITYLYFD